MYILKEGILNPDNFKKWFKNSKVVDRKGNPLVVYKGMYVYDWEKEDNKILTVIDRKGYFPAFNGNEKGIKIAGFFTSDPQVAYRFTTFSKANSGIYPAYLSIQKPYSVDAKGEKSGKFQFGPEGLPFRDAIRSGKYDGAIIYNTSDEGDVFIPINANQIKSIFNKGNWDKNSKDILEGTVDR